MVPCDVNVKMDEKIFHSVLRMSDPVGEDPMNNLMLYDFLFSLFAFEKIVCGSDGKTYRNHCGLRKQACKTQKDIVLAQFGPCASKYFIAKSNIILSSLVK